uniref:Uncharacterized protein n=1 Tax=Acrobeloides nanus TaxID=290746 RepID=A0A914CYD4_9BILA
MAATLESISIGSLISVVAGISLCLNLFVFIVILKGGFLQSTHNGIYIFALANIGGNAFQMAISTFYLGACSIIQDFIVPGGLYGFWPKFISFLFGSQWYQECLIQAIIALD